MLGMQYHMAENSLRIVENYRKSMVQVKWLPPLNGWVKLNTNRSCQDDGRIGCGGVIRSSDGEWLGGFVNFLGFGNMPIWRNFGVFWRTWIYCCAFCTQFYVVLNLSR
jgi:hypothetical protein